MSFRPWMQDQVRQVRRNFGVDEVDGSGPTESLTGQAFMTSQPAARASEQTPLTAPVEGKAAHAPPANKALKTRASMLGLGKHGFSARHEHKEHKVRKAKFRLQMKKDSELPEYDANQWMLVTMMAWRGTVIPAVFSLPFYWLTVIVHAALAFAERYTDADIFPGVDNTLMALPCGLLTLQTVFYASQCYGRFTVLHGHTVGIAGSTMVWAGLVRLHVRDDYAVRWNATRFILAASHLLYYRLDGGMDDDDWKTILGRRLLTNREHQMVLEYNGYAPFLLMAWALQEVFDELHEGDPATDRWRCAAYQRFEETALELRGHCSQINNLVKQPVPWAYFHLLNLMTVIVLSLLSWGFVGLASPYITTVAYMLIALMLLGINQIAFSMADPFGDDEVDFKLEKFLASSYQNALAHLGDTNTEALGTERPFDVSPPSMRPTARKPTSLGALTPLDKSMEIYDSVHGTAAPAPGGWGAPQKQKQQPAAPGGVEHGDYDYYSDGSESGGRQDPPAAVPVKPPSPSFRHMMTAHTTTYGIQQLGGSDHSH